MTLSGNHTKGIGMVILNNVQPTPSRERYSSKLDIALGLASVSNSLAPLGLLDTLLSIVPLLQHRFPNKPIVSHPKVLPDSLLIYTE